MDTQNIYLHIYDITTLHARSVLSQQINMITFTLFKFGNRGKPFRLVNPTLFIDKTVRLTNSSSNPAILVVLWLLSKNSFLICNYKNTHMKDRFEKIEALNQSKLLDYYFVLSYGKLKSSMRICWVSSEAYPITKITSSQSFSTCQIRIIDLFCFHSKLQFKAPDQK